MPLTPNQIVARDHVDSEDPKTKPVSVQELPQEDAKSTTQQGLDPSPIPASYSPRLCHASNASKRIGVLVRSRDSDCIGAFPRLSDWGEARMSLLPSIVSGGVGARGSIT